MVFFIWFSLNSAFEIYPYFCIRISVVYSLLLLCSNPLGLGHTLFIHSVEGQFSLQFRTIMNNAAVNILVQVLRWTYVFTFLEYIPRSEISGSYGSCVYCPRRLNHFTFSVTAYGVPVSPHSCQLLLLSVFLIMAIVVGVTCYLMDLICVSLMDRFMCLCLFVYLLWRNTYANTLPILKFELIFVYDVR